MKRIICFSKFLNFNAGGAERSTINFLKEHFSSEEFEVELISFGNTRRLPLNNIPESWTRKYIEPTVGFGPSYLVEYYLNRKKIKIFFNQLRGDVLLSYGVYAPIAINTFTGESTIFIRSEYDLAIDNNYYTGVKKVLKTIYQIFNWPFRYLYQKELRKAFDRSKVIANSQFMKSRCEALFGIEVEEVCYPEIDEQSLQTSFEQALKELEEKKGIVYVGDSIVKGRDLALAIAKRLPEQNFYFFTRNVTEKIKEGNITYYPWSNNLGHVYSKAKLVIVPSRWEEAYGRVAKEALVLNIPVLVSGRGGLPEAVGFREELIVNSFSPDDWVKKIKLFIDGYISNK